MPLSLAQQVSMIHDEGRFSEARQESQPVKCEKANDTTILLKTMLFNLHDAAGNCRVYDRGGHRR
jgi:hypothetical protein